MGSTATIPRRQQASFLRNQRFYLSDLNGCEDIGMDKLLSDASFVAFSRRRKTVRDQSRELGLGNQKRSQKEPVLFSSKCVLLLKIPEDSVLFVKIGRRTKVNDHSKIKIASLKQIAANR
jgi:hypothetical protein